MLVLRVGPPLFLAWDLSSGGLVNGKGNLCKRRSLACPPLHENNAAVGSSVNSRQRLTSLPGRQLQWFTLTYRVISSADGRERRKAYCRFLVVGAGVLDTNTPALFEIRGLKGAYGRVGAEQR